MPGSALASASRFVPAHILHREPELAAGHPLLEPLDDVRMLQLADDRHLAEEAIDGRARGGRLGDDQLQRDELPGLVVPRLVDDPHRAPAQLAERGVVGDQPRGEGARGRLAPAAQRTGILDAVRRRDPLHAPRRHAGRVPNSVGSVASRAVSRSTGGSARRMTSRIGAK